MHASHHQPHAPHPALSSPSVRLFLRLLQDSNAGTYIWTQLVLGVLYLVYFLLQCLALCQSKALDVWYVASLPIRYQRAEVPRMRWEKDTNSSPAISKENRIRTAKKKAWQLRGICADGMLCLCVYFCVSVSGSPVWCSSWR